ncbi:MAG: flagellar motor stator protein MotA [Planctomycetia bacterium]|nr:flagellar motor stator protein MotA [Planctomycetia bacterium]
MTIIVGAIVVIGAVLGGFTMAGGHIHSLFHPSELVTLGGASLGAMIVMSPTKLLKDVMKLITGALKGSPYDAAMYRELFKLSYDLLRMARRDGILVLERHVNEPHSSDVIGKYPKFAHDHHAVDFLCGGLAPIIEGASPEQTAALLNAELRVLDEEHHAPIGVLQKTADGLPGFGIVAAVLGIVITMGAINGPVEEVGHKVGAALVGTFLGILLSYGFVGPLATRLEFIGAAEASFFKAMASIVISFANGNPPKVAVEQARRGISSECRPNRAQLDELFREAEAA